MIRYEQVTQTMHWESGVANRRSALRKERRRDTQYMSLFSVQFGENSDYDDNYA
jgi:hypothetical protein